LRAARLPIANISTFFFIIPNSCAIMTHSIFMQLFKSALSFSTSLPAHNNYLRVCGIFYEKSLNTINLKSPKNFGSMLPSTHGCRALKGHGFYALSFE